MWFAATTRIAGSGRDERMYRTLVEQSLRSSGGSPEMMEPRRGRSVVDQCLAARRTSAV